jgi:hypothetical protein
MVFLDSSQPPTLYVVESIPQDFRPFPEPQHVTLLEIGLWINIKVIS